MVKDFWDQERNNEKWRKWKELSYSDDNPLKAMVESLTMDLKHRQILVSS